MLCVKTRNGTECHAQTLGPARDGRRYIRGRPICFGSCGFVRWILFSLIGAIECAIADILKPFFRKIERLERQQKLV